ncbi:MAG TPA: transglutaminaseTgpA domain-containing protein [Elusimicrobiota bacterium]|nr:transglutaminaseTgpA domain-containing protein [Elusimicrobiota bacterium]
MRPTRLGVFTVLLAGFTLFAAGSTGNNLLYLLFAATASALVLSVVAGRLNLRGVSARVEAPSQVFRDAPFSARVFVENASSSAARLVRPVGPLGAAAAFDVPPRGAFAADLRLALPARGLNRLEGLRLESLYPFGFFTTRRALPPVDLLALPKAGPGRAAGSLEADPRARTAGGGGKAREGEFFGPRHYDRGDDARLIHWKLTAKAGRPVVAEYATAPEGRVMVRLDGVDDASIERAASACRFHVEAGAETGLVGPGVEVAPARGRRQLDALLRALALAGDGATPRAAPGARSAPDEGAADSRELRRLMLFGGALVYLALFLIDDLSTASLLAFLPLVPLGFWLHERGGPFPPRSVWNALSLAMLGYLMLFDWRRSGVALANAHLLGYLLINRLFNPWPRKELRQVVLILYLAFFLVSGLTISPWYFPLFVAWLVFLGAWLALQSGADPRAARDWAPALGRLLAAGAALGTVLFLVVPRVEGLRRFNPFVASGMDKLQIRSSAVTGFTDQVTLGNFGTLRRSPARAMRLRPEPAPAPGGVIPDVYVRGAAFDVFDGRAWTKVPLDFRYRLVGGRMLSTRGGRALVRRAGDMMTFPSTGAPGPLYQVELYPMQVSIVFTVGAPSEIDGVSGAAWYDHTDSVYASGSFSAGGRYRVVTAPPGAEPTDGAEGLRARALARALILPDDPGGKEAALVARWTKGLTEPKAKADAIASRLRREYAYSLRSDGMHTSLTDFLFTTRRGNCEYFATAAAILMRRAGIPTRLVTGFRASDWNEWGRFYDVRQSEAHAWTEAWLPERGWTLYDATPSESGLSAAADEFSRRLDRWADMLQTRWYSSVIGYDQYSQRDAFLRLSFARFFERLRLLLESGLGGALPWVLGAGLLGWGLRAAPAAFKKTDEYERAERALARAGLKRRPWQTPREFAGDVARERPELAALTDLAEAHYRRRYSGAVADADERRRAAALLAQLKSRL